MSFTITEAFVTQFTSNVHHLVQQKRARLIDACRAEYGVIGESYKFERLDASEMQALVRHGDTPLANDAHSNRLAILSPWGKAHLIDKADKVRTLINPDNEYAMNIRASWNRRVDRSFHDECLVPTTTTAVAGVAGAGLDFALVNEVREYFDALEVDEEERFFGYSAQGLTTLLGDTKLTSGDYVSIKAIMAGTIDPGQNVMGFKWRKLPQAAIAYTLSGADLDTQTLYAWCKNGVGLAFSGGEMAPFRVEIDKRPDKSNATQVLGQGQLGGQCIEDALVVPVTADFKS